MKCMHGGRRACLKGYLPAHAAVRCSLSIPAPPPPCPRCPPAWPTGKMFPRLGRVHVCAFSDEALMSEV